jgi:hypothetical protein
MRQNLSLSKPSINALLADNSTALLAGISGSNREAIGTHSFFPSDFKLNHEITYIVVKQLHNRK